MTTPEKKSKYNRPAAAACAVLLGALGYGLNATEEMRAQNADIIMGGIFASETERRIGGALSLTIGHGVTVHCAEMPEYVRAANAEASKTYGQPVLTTGSVSKHDSPFAPEPIRLIPAVCDAITEAVSLSAMPDKSTPEEGKQHFQWVARLSASGIHEATHVKYPDGSEADTNCRAMQLVDDFAFNLGATQQKGKAIQEAALREWASSSAINGYAPELDNCRPGTYLDVAPELSHADEFPMTIPQTS